MSQGGGSPTLQGQREHIDANDAASSAKKEDEEYLNQMRGWLLTVGALFVGMAFQAASQPPSWMPKAEIWSLGFAKSGKHPRDTALSPQQRELAHRAVAYQVMNTVTFSMAMTLMTVLLLLDKTASRVLVYVRIVFPILSICISINFVTGITHDHTATIYISLYMVFYAMLTFLIIIYPMLFGKLLKYKLGSSSSPMTTSAGQER